MNLELPPRYILLRLVKLAEGSLGIQINFCERDERWKMMTIFCMVHFKAKKIY